MEDRTPEERARLSALTTRIRAELIEKNVVGSAEEKRLAALHANWRALGLVIRTDCERCLKPLPPELRQFCSGTCMTAS